MELLKVTEPVQLPRWGADEAVAYCRQLATDLQAVYNFTVAQDTLEINGTTGTSGVSVAGDISLYIDNVTRIVIQVGKYDSNRSLQVRVAVYTQYGSVYCVGNDTYTTVVCHLAHAIWKTETDQIVISICKREALSECTPLSRGFCMVIGTHTNQYTNISYPAILTTVRDPGVGSVAGFFLNTTEGGNKVGIHSTKVPGTNTSLLPTQYSDLAVLTPIASQYNHYLMDNALVSTLVPTCFSDTYSTITYRGHQYAQFGRYLLLDEE